eukprot:31197-Pelagococcus_subviridis.AAC.21
MRVDSELPRLERIRFNSSNVVGFALAPPGEDRPPVFTVRFEPLWSPLTRPSTRPAAIAIDEGTRAEFQHCRGRLGASVRTCTRTRTLCVFSSACAAKGTKYVYERRRSHHGAPGRHLRQRVLLVVVPAVRHGAVRGVVLPAALARGRSLVVVAVVVFVVRDFLRLGVRADDLGLVHLRADDVDVFVPYLRDDPRRSLVAVRDRGVVLPRRRRPLVLLRRLPLSDARDEATERVRLGVRRASRGRHRAGEAVRRRRGHHPRARFIPLELVHVPGDLLEVRVYAALDRRVHAKRILFVTLDHLRAGPGRAEIRFREELLQRLILHDVVHELRELRNRGRGRGAVRGSERLRVPSRVVLVAVPAGAARARARLPFREANVDVRVHQTL